MQAPAQSWSAAPRAEDECITIVASSVKDVMRQFKESGLAEKGYAIAGRVLRQTFALAGAEGEEPMFGGSPMVAATFIRSTVR